ncbi:MAG: cyclic pyranopterin phosphate synthase [Lysobacterales bacterium]|jgi:cyclic pyranopterin phosphate synthase
MSQSPHKQAEGMVDISNKDITKRIARATCQVKFSEAGYFKLINEGSPKGNIFETAKVAGIMAAKNTPQIIPMCHPLQLSKVSVICELDAATYSVNIFSEVIFKGQTGVEMEAMAAVTAAALTVYDMMKWADKGIVIADVQLEHKSGGKSGIFNRG